MVLIKQGKQRNYKKKKVIIYVHYHNFFKINQFIKIKLSLNLHLKQLKSNKVSNPNLQVLEKTVKKIIYWNDKAMMFNKCYELNCYLILFLGYMSVPKPKLGRGLSDETKSLVKEFYSRDDISRMMPGKL